MARRGNLHQDMMSIGLLAPLVIGRRLQMMAMETVAPSAKGRREALSMVTEKPWAWMEAGFAVQQEMVRSAFDFMKKGVSTEMSVAALPAYALATAAAAPIGRKVRANARRLHR